MPSTLSTRRPFGAIVLLGHLLIVTFCIWIAVSHAIYVANFGYQEIQPLSGPCANSRNPATHLERIPIILKHSRHGGENLSTHRR